MQHGRNHEERDQKHATRQQEPQKIRREEPDTELQSFTRQARSADPAPTEKGVEEERARHARNGTTGGNVDD